jgi:hypothetical protein
LEFFKVWRKLFYHWAFAKIDVNTLYEYCSSSEAVPEANREFLKVFCLTQIFDRYFLKAKGMRSYILVYFIFL